MYSICKVNLKCARKLLAVCNILYKSGKDMAQKYDLHHWDNSRLKTLVIVLLCAMKNDIYLVYDGEIAVATFQTKKLGNSLLFQKLAVDPGFANKGIGSFCLGEIEKLAKLAECGSTMCTVYDKNRHATDFYMRNGYTEQGTVRTPKYNQLKLKMSLR